MKVVFFSPNFLPLTGGLENVMRDWAYGLTDKGHKVQVITLTPSDKPDQFPFEVFRNSGFFKTWKLMGKADVVVFFNVSLKGILPWMFSLTPLVISHQSTNKNIRGSWSRFGRLKQFIADYLASRNIACSNYIASFTRKAVVIHNPYDSALFRLTNVAERSGELVFLGRLVSDKGCDLLVKALNILKKEYGMSARLTVVGDGPEKENLKGMARQMGVQAQISFVGSKAGEELVGILNSHQLMVVPSVWEEPFGIVALEGLSCGCRVVVAKSGGLPEAVGPCGYAFRRGDAGDLAAVIISIMNKESTGARRRQEVEAHLMNFTIDATVNKLVEVLNAALVECGQTMIAL